MTRNKKMRHQVVIANQDYTIVSDKSRAHVDQVVKILNQQMKEMQASQFSISTEEQALLAAVNAISDRLDLEQANDSRQRSRAETSGSIQQLEAEVKALKEEIHFLHKNFAKVFRALLKETNENDLVSSAAIHDQLQGAKEGQASPSRDRKQGGLTKTRRH